MKHSIAKGILSKNPIIAKLEGFLTQEANKESEREIEVFHPSELSDDTCFRRIQYSWMKAPSEREIIKPQTQRIFDNGSYMHKRYQKYFQKMGILWGDWYCKGCDQVVYEDCFFDPAMNCHLCNAQANSLKYSEPLMRNKKYNIKGHCDGILVLENKPTLLELKSKNSYQCKQMHVPDENHVIQATGYMYCFNHSKKYRKRFPEGMSSALILYEDKDTQQIKYFNIPYDESLLKGVFKNIDKFNDCQKKKKLLPRVCAFEANGEKRRCPYVKICFSNKKFKDLE